MNFHENKRAHRRSPTPLTPVKIGCEQKYFFGLARNISRSGIHIQTPLLIDVGEVFDIEFALPKTDLTVKCRSKVMWNHSLTFSRDGAGREGMQFLEMDPLVAERIDEWVESHAV